MSWRVKDIKRVAREWNVAFPSKDGRHSTKATRETDTGLKIAPLPAHSGDRSPMSERDTRQFCRKLDIPEDEFLAALRREN
jgi:hypothetical protein